MSLRFPVSIPFAQNLGFELIAMADGEACVQLALTEAHLNSWAVAHGGVLMTLLDVAMAHAARSYNLSQAEGGPGVVTVEMKTSFMRPGSGVLQAHAKVLHRSSTLAFCEASVFNADQALCAQASGTFMYLRALPASGRQLKSLRRQSE